MSWPSLLSEFISGKEPWASGFSVCSASVETLTSSIPETQLIFFEMTDDSLAHWKIETEYNGA